MLTYYGVRSAFFSFNSYYMTHSPSFYKTSHNGYLMQNLQVKSVLT